MGIISALEKLCQISSNTLRLSSMLNDVFFFIYFSSMVHYQRTNGVSAANRINCSHDFS